MGATYCFWPCQGAPARPPVTLTPPIPSSLFLDAKARVLHRLQQRRAAAGRVDPRRAFSRLQRRWHAARLTLRGIKEEHKARLQRYVASAVGSSGTNLAVESSTRGSSGSSVAGGSGSAGQAIKRSSSLPNAGAPLTEDSALNALANDAALGSNGLLRVSLALLVALFWQFPPE